MQKPILSFFILTALAFPAYAQTDQLIEATALDDDIDLLLSDDNDDLLLDDDPLADLDVIDDEEDLPLAEEEKSEPDLLSDDFLFDDTFLDDDPTETDEVPATRYSTTEGVNLTLPGLGALSFAPSAKALANGTATAQGYTRKKASDEQKSKTFSFGVFTITQPQAFIANDGKLKLLGKCTINEIEGDISLYAFYEKEDEEPMVRFKLLLKEELSFSLTPSREISLTRMTFDITKSETELYAKQSIFTEDKKESKVILGTIPQQNGDATCETNSVPLTSLIPDLKDNSTAEKVYLEDVTIDFPNPLMPIAGTRDVTINALAKLEHIVLWGDTHLSDSDATISLGASSFDFEAVGQQPLQLDEDLELEDPQLMISHMQGDEHPEVLIAGTMNATLPLLNTIHLPMSGEMRDDGFELRGKIDNKLDLGPVKIGDPELLIYTRTFGPTGEADGNAPLTSHSGTSIKVELKGAADMFGFRIIPIARFAKPGEAGTTGIGQALAPGMKRIMEFSAEFEGMKDIKPLEMVPGLNLIPGIKDFILRNAALGINNTKDLFIGGATTLFGVATKARVGFGKAAGLTASTLKPWKISDSISDLSGTIFDSFVFETATFAFSKAKRFDLEKNIMLQEGANIFGMIDLSQGPLDNVRKFLGGIIPKKAIASVVLNPNPRHVKLQVGLPMDIRFSSRASLHNIVIEVSGEPSVSLMVTLKFIPSHKDPPLFLTGRVEFETIGCALSATMAGAWKNPFGIKGFKVENIAVESKYAYTTPPTPIAFGFAGTMQIASLLMKVALKTGIDDQVLLGEINYLPFFVIPDLLVQAGLDLGPLDILRAIDISMHDVKMKFAPQGGQIGTLYFDPGTSASGKLRLHIPSLIKTTIEAGFNLDPFGGFKLYGKMPNINLGPLKLTGKGKDNKWGTEDDGPILYMALSLMEQKIIISGQAELLGSVGEIEVDVGLLHLRFKMLMKLWNLIDAHLVGETYRQGLRIGFKAMGKVKMGDLSETELFGDINTKGASFGFKHETMTMADIAALCDIPREIVPNIAVSDIECYLKMQG